MNSASDSLLTQRKNQYPGLRKQLTEIESWALPPCAHCGSSDTAVLVVGITGRTMCLAGLTTRVKLVANREELGERWCRGCSRAF